MKASQITSSPGFVSGNKASGFAQWSALLGRCDIDVSIFRALSICPVVSRFQPSVLCAELWGTLRGKESSAHFVKELQNKSNVT